MNKQYPVGLESVESELRLLESTIQSIENKYQQIQDLKSLMGPPDNIDFKILQSSNLRPIDQIQTDLTDLQIEGLEKLVRFNLDSMNLELICAFKSP